MGRLLKQWGMGGCHGTHQNTSPAAKAPVDRLTDWGRETQERPTTSHLLWAPGTPYRPVALWVSLRLGQLRGSGLD